MNNGWVNLKFKLILIRRRMFGWSWIINFKIFSFLGWLDADSVHLFCWVVLGILKITGVCWKTSKYILKAHLDFITGIPHRIWWKIKYYLSMLLNSIELMWLGFGFGFEPYDLLRSLIYASWFLYIACKFSIMNIVFL